MLVVRVLIPLNNNKISNQSQEPKIFGSGCSPGSGHYDLLKTWSGWLMVSFFPGRTGKIFKKEFQNAVFAFVDCQQLLKSKSNPYSKKMREIHIHVDHQ